MTSSTKGEIKRKNYCIDGSFSYFPVHVNEADRFEAFAKDPWPGFAVEFRVPVKFVTKALAVTWVALLAGIPSDTAPGFKQ
jgi:hypothetical protein